MIKGSIQRSVAASSHSAIKVTNNKTCAVVTRKRYLLRAWRYARCSFEAACAVLLFFSMHIQLLPNTIKVSSKLYRFTTTKRSVDFTGQNDVVDVFNCSRSFA